MKDVVRTGLNDTPERESRRKASREQGSIVGYCAIAFVFVALIVLVLCLTVFFKVKNVEIDGLTLYKREQILGIGGIINDENLVRTDTKLIEKRIKDNLVFVEEVSVKKKYPSTLVVDIKEAEKAADIEFGGKYSVVSTAGTILEMGNASATGGIPVIKGFELSVESVGDQLESSDKNKLRIYKELMNNIRNTELDKIVEIDMTSRSAIKLLYDSRIVIELGSSADLDYKLGYFKAVIEDKLSGEFKGRLIYNGPDSGISAIPDGVGTDDKDSSSTPAKNKNSDEDTQAADRSAPDKIEEYGYIKNNPGSLNGTDNNTNTNTNTNTTDANANTGTNNGTNNGAVDANTNANTNANANANYGYDPNAGTNTNYGYDPNAGTNTNYGYDPNAGTNTNYGYDPYAGTNTNYGYDPNAGTNTNYGYSDGYDAANGYGYGYNYQP